MHVCAGSSPAFKSSQACSLLEVYYHKEIILVEAAANTMRGDSPQIYQQKVVVVVISIPADGLVQDGTNFSALAMEILQSYTTPSK